MVNTSFVTVIGGGFAGCEAAYYLAQNGIRVRLYEMKPHRFSPAHTSDHLCELVCSNSFKATQITNASGLLKEEMRLMNSVVIQAAMTAKVSAGGALAVSRQDFSQAVTSIICNHPNIEVVRQEIENIDVDHPTIVAVGPLADGRIVSCIENLCGQRLYFYDAASPIVLKSSIDTDKSFMGSRYGKGSADYINCPMTKEEYQAFHAQLVSAETAGHADYEKNVFEGCMPVEVMAKRGFDTLCFGPLKPVGLTNQYACVQLRQDNAQGTMYNMVGFQTNLKWGEQKRVFSMIPALKNAEFVRYGVMHKNLYINSPSLLQRDFSLRQYPNIHIAGQISGVEGYIESAASGLCAAVSMFSKLSGGKPVYFPTQTMMGALASYVSNDAISKFQPIHANMGLLPTIAIRNKQERYAKMAQNSIDCFTTQQQKGWRYDI